MTPKAEHGNLLILLSDFHYRRSQNNAPYSGNYSEFINETLCLGIVFLFCTCINFSVSSVLAQWVRFPDSASCVLTAGSLLCSKRFFPGYSGFPLSSKASLRYDMSLFELISYYFSSLIN